ncbi:hypothetical protein H0H92_002924 [Tricholoma furcatifolium]|nr:hypothetical protein H0H92_002924 [Tricholoma furcatifolium]
MEQLRAFNADKIAALGHTIRAVDNGVFLRPSWKEYFSKPKDAHSQHHHQLKEIHRAKITKTFQAVARALSAPMPPAAATLPFANTTPPAPTPPAVQGTKAGPNPLSPPLPLARTPPSPFPINSFTNFDQKCRTLLMRQRAWK